MLRLVLLGVSMVVLTSAGDDLPSGVRIQSDGAFINFGQDASVRRVGNRQLQADSNLRVNGTLQVDGDLEVAGDIVLNGQSLTMTLMMMQQQSGGVGANGFQYYNSSQAFGSCAEIYLAFLGNVADGVYDIEVAGETIPVYCDMRNGGWTRVHNILTTTPQASYCTESAANAGTTASTSFYKLSDLQVNEIAASTGVRDYLYVCGDEVEFVTRTTSGGNWTSLRNQGMLWSLTFCCG